MAFETRIEILLSFLLLIIILSLIYFNGGTITNTFRDVVVVKKTKYQNIWTNDTHDLFFKPEIFEIAVIADIEDSNKAEEMKELQEFLESQFSGHKVDYWSGIACY